MRWQRIEKSDFGYAVQVPEGWQERPPNLKNSPWETARFVDPADRRHSVIVFRGLPHPGLQALEVAERVQFSLESVGFGEFHISETQVAGRPGARLECAKHDVGRTWAVREYFVINGEVRFALGCGTSVPDEDDPLFAAMSQRMEILESEE